jgi:hypothetical protein
MQKIVLRRMGAMEVKGPKSSVSTGSNNYRINKVYPAVMVVKAGCVSMSCLAGKSNMQ